MLLAISYENNEKGWMFYLSRVGCHGLDDLLLTILLRVILQVGLGVG